MKHWTRWLVVVVSVAFLAGLVVLARLREAAPPPTGEALAVAPEAQPYKRAAVLGEIATIDKATWEAAPRDARIEHIHGMFRARGLQISEDGLVVYQSRQRAGMDVAMQLTGVRLAKGRDVVSDLKLAQDPRPEVSNEVQRGTITFLNVVRGLDLQFVYDGGAVKENVILHEAFREALAGTDADRIELLYRYSDLDAENGGPPLQFLNEGGTPVATGDQGTAKMYLGQGGMPDFTLDTPFIQAPGNRIDLPRYLDLTDTERPEVRVSVPLEALSGLSWPVTIDPSLVDSMNSMNSWSQGDVMARGPDGALHVLYSKWSLGPEGRWRWHILHATGEREPGGMVWTRNGIVAPSHYTSGQWSDQYYPSACVTSTGTLHAFFIEYRREVGQWEVDHAYKPAGEPWVDTGVIQRNGTYHHHPTCAVDQNDNVYVVFMGSGGGCAVFAQFDPDVTSDVEPPGIGEGGETVVVQGGWQDMVTLKCEWHCQDVIGVDGDDTLLVGYNRCRGGTWLFLREAGQRDWVQKNWPNNRGWDEWYQPWWDANDNRGLPDAAIGVCPAWNDNRYTNPDLFVDERGDAHMVWSMGMGSWCNEQARFVGHPVWFYRTAYARFDRSLDRWTDWAFPQGPNTLEENQWQEKEPVVVVDDPDPDNFGNRGNVHVLYWAESIPRSVRYARMPVQADGSYSYQSPEVNGWEDLGDLVHGSQAIRWHVQARGSLFPENNRVLEDLLDITFVEDSSQIVYVSTGQPVEKVRLKTPINHRYISEIRPTFRWDRLSTDQGDGRVTYIFEIATSPIFLEAEIVHTSPVIQDVEYALPEDLANGRYYYWRVTPSNALGPGFPSDPYEVGIDTQPPQAFDLLTPENNADPRTKTPTFTWEEALDPN